MKPIEYNNDASDPLVDNEAQNAIQAICDFNRTKNSINDILIQGDTVEGLTNPPPAEPVQDKPSASARDMGLALTMVLERIDAETKLKKILEVNNLLSWSRTYTLLL